MAFNFPDGATNGQKYTADNGLVYVYNGQVWSVDGVGTVTSMDTRYLTIDGDNVVSGSSQLTASFDSRYIQTGSFNTLSSSVDSRLDILESSNIPKVSGMVAAGTFVTLDNLKVTVTTSGSRGLSIGAVSTNFEADVSGWYADSGGGTARSSNNQSYTTTESTSLFGWNFTVHGNTAQYQIRDKTNDRFYRVTMMIGLSYISNFISIERLF
jgi:hypothetical protein